MAWNGYIALGTYTSSVFTESTATGYARQKWTFGSSQNGQMQGTSAALTFSATSAVVSTYNAYAFFAAVSGGNPLLVYPLLGTFKYGAGYPYTVYPHDVLIAIGDGVTMDGLNIDNGYAEAMAGIQANVMNYSNTTGITAHAGGGQSLAVLLTSTINRVNTVATVGDSVKLPPAIPGEMCVIINAATNALGVYPSTGDTINGLSANTSVNQPGNSVDAYYCAVAGAWHAEVGTGYSSNMITETVQDSIVAHAGGGQASATQITAQTSRVITVATAGDSVKLPTSAAGLELIVINAGTKPMQVFGTSPDTIDGVATGTGVSQMPNSMCIYSCVTAGAWFSNGLGTGYSGSLPTVSFTDALTAHAGGGQASATACTTVLNRFTTVATAGDSAVLPASAPGLQITVINATATNAMNVFPNGTDQINALGASAAFSLAATKTCTFYSTVAGQWHTLLSN